MDVGGRDHLAFQNLLVLHRDINQHERLLDCCSLRAAHKYHVVKEKVLSLKQ